MDSYASSSSGCSSCSGPEKREENEKEGNCMAEGKENQNKKGKKTSLNPEKWKNRQVKRFRNPGKAYTSTSKSKKLISERNICGPCGNICTLKCKSNEAGRQSIFKGYCGMLDLQRQREYIVDHTSAIKPKYRYTTTENHRNLNSAFYFEENGEKIRVYKKLFKATLDINDRPIRTDLVKRNGSGNVESDMRGKHVHQKTVAPEVKDSVRKFIKAILRIESHYLGAQTTREFIECGKSLADIYRDYKEDQERQQLPYANYVMFNRIFITEFNISFM
ncbi:unnamed protein product [Acanthoscelides obtectus]|uniref:Uncharacterized protein n=1 Tax=Acanthoscelides obtectus TaxID=200917 RepID=A0A9P0KPM8_ACAOB|nr:unnamed protein product [Acanthoscelides obtectus]CAK1664836.1 hypothetical protein AOBTE_LOCUS24498 [Acanthoscelides obtectus]